MEEVVSIANVKCEKGTEDRPTVLRIQFYQLPIFFAFHEHTRRHFCGSDEEFRRHEVIMAIEKCSHFIYRELKKAAEDQLGIRF